MDEQERQTKIAELQEKVDRLPRGYISVRTVKGHVYYYHWWSENGKKKSRYLKTSEAEALSEQITRRRELQAQKKDLRTKGKKKSISAMKESPYFTKVTTGTALECLICGVRSYEKLDCYVRLERYLQDDKNWTRVCAVYGLRWTGKTTMIFQAIGDMDVEKLSKTAYVKMRTTDIMHNLTHDLDILHNAGYKYIFVDEATLM